mgnify:CR=1 FL=1
MSVEDVSNFGEFLNEQMKLCREKTMSIDLHTKN